MNLNFVKTCKNETKISFEEKCVEKISVCLKLFDRVEFKAYTRKILLRFSLFPVVVVHVN